MTAALFTALFLVALAASLVAKLWLARRQTRFVAAHRAAVPPAFGDHIALAAHQKAVEAAPPQAYSPGEPSMCALAGSIVTEKPSPKPMP